jgi:hypothetical protein
MKNNVDLRRKYNVGDIVIFKQTIRNFKDNNIDKREVIDNVINNPKNKNKSMNTLLKPYLVKGKPSITYGGITKIIEVDDYFNDFVFYCLDFKHDNKVVSVSNQHIIKKISLGDYEYDMIKKLSKDMTINKLLKFLDLK